MTRRRSTALGRSSMAGVVVTLALLSTPAAARAAGLRVDAPASARAGHAITITVETSAPRQGQALQVCLLSPVGERHCVVTTVQGPTTRIVTHAPRPGSWTVRADSGGAAATDTMEVGPHGRRMRILAVGDSLMEHPAVGLRGLIRKLKGYELQRDVRPGTGISKNVFDWRREAAAVSVKRKPDVVVIFLGWNEGYPFGKTLCCGQEWIDEWAARARRIMTSFERGGAARVYWLTLPAFRRGRRVVQAVNTALVEATQPSLFGAAAEGGTDLLDMGALFTPDMKYSGKLRVEGRLRTVRMADGIHLNLLGGRVAAGAILDAMGADGIEP